MDSELKSVVESLDMTGGDKFFWRTRAEIPGYSGRPYIGEQIPLSSLRPEEIEDHVKLVREQNPHVGEIIVSLHAGGHDPVKDSHGNAIRKVFRPPVPPPGSAPVGMPGAYVDPEIERQRKELERERAQVNIDEEKMRLENRKKSLAKGTPAAAGDVDSLWPLGVGVPFKVIQVAPGEFAPVPLDADDLEDGGGFSRRGRGRFDRDREPRGLSFQEQLTLQREQAAAAERLEMLRMMMQPKEDSSLKVLLAILPALTGGQTKLPEIMALVDGMRKGDQMAMKHALEMQGDIMGKVADHMLESGSPPDLIDQAKRIVEVATDGFGKVVKHTTGRESLLNPDKPKGLPAPPAETKGTAPVARKPQAPPRPIEVAGPPRPLPPPTQEALSDSPSPEDVAKAEGARRCVRLLSLHEREMRIESDPAVFFEDEADAKQIVEFVLGLPKTVRAAIEKGDPKEIYDAFRVYVPAEIDALFALMADPAKGKDYTEWASEFWAEVQTELAGEDEEPEPERPERVAE